MIASRSSRTVTKELFLCAKPAVVGLTDNHGGFVAFSVITTIGGGVRHSFEHRFAPYVEGASGILAPTSQGLVSAAPYLVWLRGQSNRSFFAAFVRATACHVVGLLEGCRGGGDCWARRAKDRIVGAYNIQRQAGVRRLPANRKIVSPPPSFMMASRYRTSPCTRSMAIDF